MKSYANTPGGIGLIGTGSDTSLVSMLKNQIRSMGESGGPGLISGMGSSSSTTTDMIKQVLTGNTPGNISTEDIIHEKIDDSGIEAQGAKDGDTYGTSFASSLKDKLTGMLGGKGGSGGSGGSLVGNLLTGGGSNGDGKVSSVLDAGGAVGGALPGMAGVSGMAATVTGISGALLGALPAVGALGAGLATIGGGFALLMAGDKSFATQVKSDFSGMEQVAENAAKPLAGPLLAAFSQLGSFVKSIGPELKDTFASAAPLIQPLLKGLESLVSGLLPGLMSILKAAKPAFDAFSGILGSLGKDVGGMLSGFAPAIAASSVIFKRTRRRPGRSVPDRGQAGRRDGHRAGTNLQHAGRRH